MAGSVPSRNTQGPQRFSNSQRTEAAVILAANKHQVEAIAEALLEQKTLDGAEIEAIISGRPDVLHKKQWAASIANAELFGRTFGALSKLNGL
jgi:hypothetical protein